MEKELILKGIFIVGLMVVSGLSTNAAEYEHPLVAFCEHMGYNHSLDTNENRFVIDGNCFFPDGKSCKLSEFYDGTCGIDYQRDINCRKKGQVVFEQFEKCCEGFYTSECDYVLCQPTCESKLLEWSYPEDEEVTLPVAYCSHMRYSVKIDSELNRPMCVFDDGSYCTTDSFYEGECGKDKVKQFRERKEGEYVFTEFERCEGGLVPSELKYLLEQPHCKYPSVFRKFWTKLKSLVRVTKIDISDVPFCKDINVTGTDCHYIGDIFDKGTYNYSDGICKQYERNPVIEHPKIGVCFSTLENDMKTLKNVFERCWNCTDKKEECVDYDKLNYTTLKISRKEFEKLPCYRQRDWLKGWCYPSECNEPNPPICTAIYAVACYNSETSELRYFKNLYLNNTLPEEEPINTINISKVNTSFKFNPNEKVPDDYILITIYETVCQCIYGNDCPGFICPCDEHCYNQSRIIWVPRNN